jgi:CHAD domain-containing protein
MNCKPSGRWSVAEPHLVRRSEALLKAIEYCCECVECEEHIHKLRVASRRLEAALKSFGGLLPRKHRQRIRKQVRGIRRAAGRIRDLDVLILRLEESGTKKMVPALRDQRCRLADELVAGLSARDQNRLRRDLKQLLLEHSEQPEPDLRTWAAEQMQPVAARFLDAAHDELHKTRKLHRLRLSGKRLRYSLELFQDQLDQERVTSLLKLLRGLQEQLGDMNDHASARVLLADVVESDHDQAVRDAAHKLAKREKRLWKRDRRRFLKWWRKGASRRIAESVRQAVSG